MKKKKKKQIYKIFEYTTDEGKTLLFDKLENKTIRKYKNNDYYIMYDSRNPEKAEILNYYVREYLISIGEFEKK